MKWYHLSRNPIQSFTLAEQANVALFNTGAEVRHEDHVLRVVACTLYIRRQVLTNSDIRTFIAPSRHQTGSATYELDRKRCMSWQAQFQKVIMAWYIVSATPADSRQATCSIGAILSLSCGQPVADPVESYQGLQNLGNRKVFPTCVRLAGYYYGCCDNREWPDYSIRCPCETAPQPHQRNHRQVGRTTTVMATRVSDES